ncbi:MAG: YicC/YloC family endoribonuclease, partial [Bacteroidota bacterium]
MIQSMTGFGKHVVQLPFKKITIEIKSLNSKNLDINARIPQIYREKELELRKMIADSLLRGKIDFGLYVEITGEETTSEINEGVVKKYMEQLRNIAEGDAIKLLELALRMPDTLKSEKGDIDEQEYLSIKDAMKEALLKIRRFRDTEGSVLEKDFKLRLKTLGDLLNEVQNIDTERLESIRERLERALSELQVEVDANRFEQELIYYLEKYDITEEKVRLANHLKYFETT